MNFRLTVAESGDAPSVRARSLVAAMALASMLVGQFVAAPPASAACAPGELAPAVTLLVSQGGSDYGALTRGRTTLIQALMTLPGCADSSDSITLNSVAVDVKNGDTTLKSFNANIGRTLPPCCALDATNTQLYPRFYVAGSDLAPGGTEKTGFVGNVTSTVTYTANGVTGQVTPSRTVVFAGDQELTVQFVRMGNTDPGAGVTNWTNTDSSTFSTALATFQRLLPMHESGFNWRLEPDILNLGQGTTQTPGVNVWEKGSTSYCGDQDKFLAVGAALQQRWLAARTMPISDSDSILGTADGPPDVTVGVISGRLVSGCNEQGRAMLGGNAAYFVLRSDNGGGIAAHEVAHLFGAPHSRSYESDPNSLAYNVPGAQFLGGGVSLMHPFTPFTNATALAQSVDWALAQCHMGSGVACAAPPLGSPAATSRTLKIAGTSDGTSSGTNLNSHVGPAEEVTSEDPDSPFVLVYKDGSLPEPHPTPPVPATGSVLATFRLPSAEESVAAASSSDVGATEIRGEFDWNEAATVVEVYRGDPEAGGALLYQRGIEDVSVGGVEVTASEWTFEPFVETPADEFDPVMSPGGEILTYVATEGPATRLVAAPTDGSASPGVIDVSDLAVVAHPSVSGRMVGDDGRAHHVIAFVCDDGDLCVTDLDVGSMTFSAVEKIYSCADTARLCVLGDLPLLAGDLSGPAFLPVADDGAGDRLSLVASINGDLFRVDLSGPTSAIVVTAERLTDTPDVQEVEPSGGPVHPGTPQQVAYRRASADGEQEIWTLDLDDPHTTQAKLLCCGFDPSWGGDVIAYESADGGSRSGQTYLAVVRNPQPQPVATGTTPSLLPEFGDTLALSRDGGSGRDVYVGRTTTRRDITVSGRSSRPEETRAFFWICSEAEERCAVIGADLPVRQVDPDNDPTLVAATLDDLDTTYVPRGWNVTAGLSTGITIAFGNGSELTDNEFEPETVFAYPADGFEGSACDVVPVWPVVQDPSIASHASQGDISLSLSGPDFHGVEVGDGSLRHLVAADVHDRAGRAQECWSLGEYELTAQATGSNGRVTSATTRFRITGISSRVTTRPEVLNINSSGSPVTVYVDLVDADEGAISSASITHICHVPIDPVVAYQIVTEGDDVTSPKRAVVKFSREQVNARIKERVEDGDCALGRYAALTIQGRGSTGTPFTFTDTDPSAPTISS